MLYQGISNVGRAATGFIEEVGYAFAIFVESIYWIFVGPSVGQPVRMQLIVAEMMNVAVRAVPILALLAMTNGAMLAIQGIYTLKDFDAEPQVVPAIALSITREFAVLIVGIVVAGRSGSAIAARIGSMQMSQEIDALRVMGVNPIRYLVAPILVAMLVMFPMLTIFADFVGMAGGGVLVSLALHIPLETYATRCFDALEVFDIVQGLLKSVVFAVLITLVGAVNGFSVEGGAEGLGKGTTRSVVLCISSIVVADMIFTFFLSR